MTTIDHQGPNPAHGNGDYPWDDFGSEEYFEENYIELRDDDRQIVEIVRNFFVDILAQTPLPAGARGIDVGTGANLYPALTMLPFCSSITLYEYSAANVEWLERQHKMNWPTWDRAWKNFWELLCIEPVYATIPRPKETLSKRVQIVKGNVLEAPAHERWDLGTMFFVAESITGDDGEFQEAMKHFFAMLKPGAPFAMAFMEHSKGYHVGGHKYPATDISLDDVYACLHARAEIAKIHPVVGDNPLREGYTRMIVAHGRVKHVEELR